MNIKNYRVWILILGMLSLVMCILKSCQTHSSEIVEVNYIGDMERENQTQTDTENEKSQTMDSEGMEVELLEVTDTIRVLLMNSGYSNMEHQSVEISAESGLQIECNGTVEYLESNEHLSINFTDGAQDLNTSSLVVTPVNTGDKLVLHSVDRGYGEPAYYGALEIYNGTEGLIIVNELNLELYLRGVLPSEMPSTFEIEALKAQAVCARSYAYTHMTQYGYPEYEAHINDSTDYQVYNNVEESESCNQAIEETCGEKLAVANEVVTTYFFSTSSGQTTDVTAWGEEVTTETVYLQGISVSGDYGDYEKDLPWYKWTVALSPDQLENMIETYCGQDIGTLQSVEIEERGTGGVVLALEIEGSLDKVRVVTEYEIRSALGSDGGDAGYSVSLQDGSVVEWNSILPSAFFDIEVKGDTYYISGGGFGHGIGMSQYGADEMAKVGYGYLEILQFFYQGVELIV